MRKILSILGLTAVTLAAPGLAQARSCEQRAHERVVAGTVLGAIGGAVIGNAVSHRNGALIGGLGGAVVGNQLARRKCNTGYAYNRHEATYRGYSSGVGPATRCTMRDVGFYDARGEFVTRRVQTCR